MQKLLSITKQIDRLNAWIGRAVSWLTLVMILIGAYNAVVRYLGRYIGTNLSSNIYLELQWYLFSVIFLLGAAWTLKEDAHVRVDVLYAKLSKRARRRIDLVGTVLLLFPFSVFVLWTSWPSVMNSLSIREGSPDPGGLPRYPIKLVILVCFVFLLLQGVSELVRLLNETPDEPDGDGGADPDAPSPQAPIVAAVVEPATEPLVEPPTDRPAGASE